MYSKRTHSFPKMPPPLITVNANIPIDITAQALANAHRILRDEMTADYNSLPPDQQLLLKASFETDILRINVLIAIIKLMYPTDTSTPLPSFTCYHHTTYPAAPRGS